MHKRDYTVDETLVAPAPAPASGKQEYPNTRRNRRHQIRANARAAKQDGRDILRLVAGTERCPCQDLRIDRRPAPDCFLCHGEGLVVHERPAKVRGKAKRH